MTASIRSSSGGAMTWSGNVIFFNSVGKSPAVEDGSTETEPGQISTNVPDTPNKILVSRIPDYLQDEQVIELLKSFGELKAFVLVKDKEDDVSKVYIHLPPEPLT